MHNSAMFTLPYFAVVFLVILQVSAGGVSFDGAATRPHPFLNHNLLPQCAPQYIVTPQYNPTSGSIFANVPSVTLFTNKFFQVVHTSPILREVLDFSQTAAKQYADFLREYAKVTLCKRGVENDNAAAIGEFTARAITPNFDILTLPVVARAFCNSAVNFLFVSGALELHNAEDLSLAFAQALIDSAKVTMNSDPTSKFPSLTNGYVKYFESLGLFSKANAQLLAYYIGNEWTVAAVNYRWL